MTTALFILRAKQIGFTLDELDALSVGEVYDIITESANDKFEYPQKGTQDDISTFFG